jgi:hypothetical protein
MQERKETKGKGIKRRYEDAPSTLEGEDVYLLKAWKFLFIGVMAVSLLLSLPYSDS